LGTETPMVGFFNATKTAAGNYSIGHNSKFAKLYRLAIGYVKESRYSRADQLLRKLEGCIFIATQEPAIDRGGNQYFRAKNINPVEPIEDPRWFNSGTLKHKDRSRKRRTATSIKLAIKKQSLGNGLAKSKQNISNELAMENSEEPHVRTGSSDISTSLKDITYNIESLPHIKPVPIDEYKTTMTVDAKGAKHYQHHQRPNETKEEYLNRVLDESLASWIT